VSPLPPRKHRGLSNDGNIARAKQGVTAHTHPSRSAHCMNTCELWSMARALLALCIPCGTHVPLDPVDHVLPFKYAPMKHEL